MNPRDLPALDREIAALKDLVFREISADTRVPLDVAARLIQAVMRVKIANDEQKAPA